MRTCKIENYKENDVFYIGRLNDHKTMTVVFPELTGPDYFLKLNKNGQDLIPIPLTDPTQGWLVSNEYTIGNKPFKYYAQIVKIVDGAEQSVENHPPFYLEVKYSLGGFNDIEREHCPDHFKTVYDQMGAVTEDIIQSKANGDFNGEVKVGTVETLNPDQKAYIHKVGETLNFGLPQGRTGNVCFPTFDVIGNELVMNAPADENKHFNINENGELEVMINANL